MTRSEYPNGSLLLSYTSDGASTALQFYKCVFSDEMMASYQQRFGTFEMSEPLPPVIDALWTGTINIGDHYWQVVICQGHSPEHACPYCPGLKLIIAGDQILQELRLTYRYSPRSLMAPWSIGCPRTRVCSIFCPKICWYYPRTNRHSKARERDSTRSSTAIVNHLRGSISIWLRRSLPNASCICLIAS